MTLVGDDRDGLDDDDRLDDDRFARLRAAGLLLRPPGPPASAPSSALRLLGDDVEVMAGALALGDPVGEATAAGYQNSWAFFDRWCHLRGYGDAASADEMVVVAFIAHQLDQGLSMSTIRGRLASIAYGFRIQGRPSPTDGALVARAKRNAARRARSATRQAAPYTAR